MRNVHIDAAEGEGAFVVLAHAPNVHENVYVCLLYCTTQRLRDDNTVRNSKAHVMHVAKGGIQKLVRNETTTSTPCTSHRCIQRMLEYVNSDMLF